MADQYYMAFDPGLTTGWARFDENGTIESFGQFKWDERDDALRRFITPNCKAVIVEDYLNHGWQQQRRWSRNETSKLIGAIEAICNFVGVPVHLQRNTVKAIGYKWAGMDGPPSDHSISHQYDAIAHGTYWLQSNGVRKPGQGMKLGDIDSVQG